MNYTVHALMYTYYAFRALQFRIPKWTMMTITALQLLQMVVGCGLTVFTYKVGVWKQRFLPGSRYGAFYGCLVFSQICKLY